MEVSVQLHGPGHFTPGEGAPSTNIKYCNLVSEKFGDLDAVPRESKEMVA
jgi:hypothetical protein